MDEEMAQEVEKEETEFVNKLVQETIAGYRLFNAPDVGDLKVRFPNNDEVRLAELRYSKAFTEALKEGLLTYKEMETLLQERGIWTEKEDQKVRDLEKTISLLETTLAEKKVDDKTKKVKEIAQKLSDIRAELITISMERQMYLANTAESKADESRTSFLVYKCVSYAENNAPLWANEAEFLNENRSDLLVKCTTEVLTFMSGLSSTFMENVPEAMILREDT